MKNELHTGDLRGAGGDIFGQAFDSGLGEVIPADVVRQEVLDSELLGLTDVVLMHVLQLHDF